MTIKIKLKTEKNIKLSKIVATLEAGFYIANYYWTENAFPSKHTVNVV